MNKQSVEVRSFTTYSNGLSIVLSNEVGITTAFDPAVPPPPPPPQTFRAIWDTGATASVITNRVVSALGLSPIGVAQVHTAGGTTLASVYLVAILLPNKVGFQSVRVTEAPISGADVLIGMDIISKGDFAVTNFGGKTVFTFRVPSVQLIDFVQSGKPGAVPPPQSGVSKVGRNDLCPCGSGKKFKKCCLPKQGQQRPYRPPHLP